MELQTFNPKVRRIFDEGSKQWFFAVVDVIEVLTDSTSPRKYWGDMKRREREIELSAICRQFPLKHKTNNRTYQVECANMEGILRIIQSIPSKKAEPFKRWLAQVGKEKLEESQAQALQAFREKYRALGREEAWIDDRISFPLSSKISAYNFGLMASFDQRSQPC